MPRSPAIRFTKEAVAARFAATRLTSSAGAPRNCCNGRRPAPRPCAPLATLPSAPFGLVIIASETTGRRIPDRRGTRRCLMPSSGPAARLRSPTPPECLPPARSTLLRWATAIPSNAQHHHRPLPIRAQVPASIAVLLLRSDGTTPAHEPREVPGTCAAGTTLRLDGRWIRRWDTGSWVRHPLPVSKLGIPCGPRPPARVGTGFALHLNPGRVTFCASRKASPKSLGTLDMSSRLRRAGAIPSRMIADDRCKLLLWSKRPWVDVVGSDRLPGGRFSYRLTRKLPQARS